MKRPIKYRILTVIGAAGLLLTACIPSLHPFYTASDLVFDNRLVGAWYEKDKTETGENWTFEKAGDDAYKLTVTDKEGKTGEFSANLFKLKEQLFLDLIPLECEYATNQADLVGFSMFPGHLLVWVSSIEPELGLAFFDFEWLGDFLKQNPKALAHHREPVEAGGKDAERIILTAATRDLQKFVLKHLGKDELFEEPSLMVRKTAGQQAATAQ